MCCLRPGIPGVSDNIRVRSIVGRFLEHTRVYYFENGGQGELYGSSADWMERNFFRRVEVAFPLRDPEVRRRMLLELDYYLCDNVQAWILQSDGTYVRTQPGEGETPFSAQMALLEDLGEGM
jgi:polyphosphate kinase